MTENFQEIHGAVDRLLLEQSEYSPVELLLAEGRLSYSDYEAWRCGQVAVLEDVLAGNPARIRTLLKQARLYAALLGLNAERREFFSWGDRAGRLLQLSGNPVLEELCSVHYRRVGNEIQLDLFMDNTANVLVNGIVEALTSRRENEAIRLVGRLLDAAPSHPRLGVLEDLCNAAQRLTEPVDDCFAENKFIEGYLVPLATSVLGVGARDFLSPFWRRLAETLRGQPFVAETPFLHASYPLGCARDWAGVKAAILEEAAWQNYPLLRCRLAEAEFHLDERQAALAIWCRLCWDFPVTAEKALENVPDKELRSAWKRYRDLDVEPELDTRFFPAWLLLERADARNALALAEVAQDSDAGRAYSALYELLAGGISLSERTMKLRQKLKQAHPGVFAIYMRKISGR